MAKTDKIIGICVSQLQDVGYSEMVNTICRYAREKQFRVLIYGGFVKMDRMNSYVKGEASIFSDIPVGELSALVLLGETIQYRKLLQRLRDQAVEVNTPVITIDYEMDNCFNIQLDYSSTFEKVVRHVVEEHHCQKPFFMAGFYGNDFSDNRLEVYKRVLRENNLPICEEHIAYGDFWEQPSKKACEEWMKRTDDMPDAVICANDMMAITVCNVLKAHNLRVPEDVIVTGFDGIDLERFCTPRLTTAQVDREEIGSQLVDIIQKIMDNPDLKPYSTMIPFHMRCSESCGCKPIELSSPNQYVMEVYGRMAHNRIHVNGVFQMMNELTEGHSAMEMIGKLHSYVKDITKKDLFLFVNQKFCKYTDIPVSKSFTKEKVLVLLAQRNGNVELPLFEIEDRRIDCIPESLWEKEDQILFLPLHWQEEVYGYLALQYSEEAIDYERLCDFMMTLVQAFGTVRKQSHLHEMYIRDSLTSLYNRRGFYGEIKRQIKKLREKSKKIFLASIDLDGLKYINDHYGHSEGDIAISRISKILEQTAEEDGFCARFGGDEFVVARIWDSENIEENYAECFQERLEHLINQWNQVSDKPYHLEASCGMILEDITNESEIDELIKKADDEMYRCKGKHHNVRSDRRDD